MIVEIKYPRFAYQFGRNIAFGQLWVTHNDESKMVIDGSIAQIMECAKKNLYVIKNAQEILDLIVRQHGFAS